MATTLENLEARLAAVEEKLERLVGKDGGNGARVQAEMSPLERFIAERRVRWSAEEVAALRRAAGIPPDMPRIGVKALREMMLADGIEPEDRILSSEIIRMRDETRP